MKFECCKSTTDVTVGALQCSKCKHNYHVQCLYPTEKKPVAAEFKKAWVCPDCKSKQPRQTNNDNTPVRPLPRPQQGMDNVNSHRGGSSTVSPPTPTASSSDTADLIRSIMASEIEQLKEYFRKSLSEELKPIINEIANIKESLGIFNQQFEKLTKRMDKVETEIKIYKSTTVDVNHLKSSIAKLEYENNCSEQWSRRSNIEIYGIPEKRNENLFHILKTIADRAKSDIDLTSDIDFITRVSPKNTDTKKVKPIVIRFLARYKKDDFLSQVRKLKLKASDIGYTTCENSIYFNEHLTSFNKTLLRRAKTIAKEKQYTYVWVKNCAIFVRRNDTSPVILISNEQDLNKIK